MKKLLLTAAASLALTAAYAGVAHADAQTNWTVDNTKTTNISELITINKTVNVNISDTSSLDSLGKADALVNSSVVFDTVGTANVVDTKGIISDSNFHVTGLLVGDEFNYDIHRSALINNSVKFDRGIGQLNQDDGNNSNQGNVIAAAFVFGGNDVVEAQAYVEQLSEANSSRNIEDPVTGLVTTGSTSYSLLFPETGLFVPLITADLEGSFLSDIGVYMGNQNSGNNNQQHNALAAAVGDNAFTALGDAGLHQVNADNSVFDYDTVKQDTIKGSINLNQGIVAFNQSVGDNNNQATVVNVAAISSFVGLP